MKPSIALAVAGLALASLTACAPTVSLDPAPDANNPDCAYVTVQLPDGIDDLERRKTDAQATGAWGDPAAVILRCGVAVPGPSTLMCVTLGNVDWLRDDSQAPIYVFTTYGRDPAVEVIVDGEAASGTNALIALERAVAGSIPQTRHCTNPDEVLEVPDLPGDDGPGGSDQESTGPGEGSE